MIEIKLTEMEAAALLLLATLGIETYPTMSNETARLLDRIPQEVFDSLGEKLNGVMRP